MDTKKLPIGIQTFEDIIKEGYLYIDKTADIHNLISESKGCFLSRPRRFGKSLLVSTLDAIFSGKKDLFKGLNISKTKYNWKEHPVLRFSFNGSEAKTSKELEEELSYQVEKNANKLNISLKAKKSNQKLDELIESLGTKKDKSVILVDEYDKPILNNINSIEQAEDVRDKLKSFYEIMKENDQNIRFRLVAGVSKFSHSSLFSGDNNLKNITMHNSFSSILGYTQDELEKYFDEHITKLAKNQKKSRKETLENIMNWYNGYQFSKKGKKVYNPFSTLLLFDEQDFKNYWFESGTPTFLLNMMIEQGCGIQDMEKIEVRESVFSSYDLSNLNLTGLLYETGYLTIKGYKESDNQKLYTLDYPNREVKDSFIEHLLNTIYKQRSNELLRYTQDMSSGFKNNDLDNVFDRVNTVLSRIPYDLFTKYEGHYHSLIGLMFDYAGLAPHSEEKSRKGDSDMVLETKDNVYIFEFKTKKDTGNAIEDAFDQIKNREYSKKYEIGSRDINHVAVEIDTEKREARYEMRPHLKK